MLTLRVTGTLKTSPGCWDVPEATMLVRGNEERAGPAGVVGGNGSWEGSNAAAALDDAGTVCCRGKLAID
jgi:hypothetical protein